MELKGSKTEANLWKAFAGESMARNKYTYFASKARKEGYEQIAAIFEEGACQAVVQGAQRHRRHRRQPPGRRRGRARGVDRHVQGDVRDRP